MKDEKIKDLATKICSKMIDICKNNKVNNRNLLEIYDSLIEKEYDGYKTEILTYIPLKLAEEGYEIVSSEPFCIKKY